MGLSRWLCLGGLLVACGDSSSTPNTMEMSALDEAEEGRAIAMENREARGRDLLANVRVVGMGGMTLVNVQFPIDFSARTLQGIDRLSVQRGSEMTFLDMALDAQNLPIYTAMLEGDDPGMSFTVSLDSEEFGDASVTVTLPERVTLENPRAKAVPPLDTPFEVTWSVAEGAHFGEASYLLSCGWSVAEGRNMSDDEGRQTIEIDTSDVQGPCDLTVGAERMLTGRMKGSWYGSAYGTQRDEHTWLDALETSDF